MPLRVHMRYEPALDGLRALAIILVMLFHAQAPVAGGFLGVDLFFVLSGFLITTLLLVEIDTRGRIDIARFYLRRILRLAPALMLMLAAFLLVAAPLFALEPAVSLRFAALAALYLSDYSVAFWDIPQYIRHTWSLSVEEHFYLLWPLILVAGSRRWNARSLVIALGTAYVLATLLRWVFLIKGQTWQEVYYRFDTRLSGLVLGAWLAAVKRDAAWSARLQSAAPKLLWLVPIAAACLQFRWDDLWMLTWGVSLFEWATLAVVVAALTRESQVEAMLSQPVLVWTGKISYGLYLWHYPIFVYLRARFSWNEVLLIGLPITVTLASISFYTVEAWCSRRRHALQARPLHVSALKSSPETHTATPSS